MNVGDMAALSELLNPDGDDDLEMVQNPNKGSVFAPGDIGSKKQQKDLAKPFSQMEVKVGKKDEQVKEEQENKTQKKVTKKNDKNEIWEEDEVQSFPQQHNETRKRPEVDLMYKQQVGTEDVYGGFNDLDPSSTTCQFLLLKIALPNTRLGEISLEVQKQNAIVQTTQYFLNYALPYKVKSVEGKAKWIADKSILELTLPIIREDPF